VLNAESSRINNMASKYLFNAFDPAGRKNEPDFTKVSGRK
jgi:hypothetical protein